MPTDPGLELATYAELCQILGRLPMLLREARRGRRLTLAEAAEQIGCSAPTVLRMERGQTSSVPSTIAVLRWLDQTETTDAR